MKNISGYISEKMAIAILLWLLPLGTFGQDTLRTYGPRLSLDLARVGYLLADPAEPGVEASVDTEIYRNLYPVVEAGYSTISEETETFNYSSGGVYLRAGADYNLLPRQDRSVHHDITGGLRYGVSFFNHRAGEVVIPGEYWGDFLLDSYSNTLTGHWIELVAGIRTEVMTNFFVGWNLRYRILINPSMDPLVTPQLIPGFGSGTTSRRVGFTYSVGYKIPVLKR